MQTKLTNKPPELLIPWVTSEEWGRFPRPVLFAEVQHMKKLFGSPQHRTAQYKYNNNVWDGSQPQHHFPHPHSTCYLTQVSKLPKNPCKKAPPQSECAFKHPFVTADTSGDTFQRTWSCHIPAFQPSVSIGTAAESWVTQPSRGMIKVGGGTRKSSWFSDIFLLPQQRQTSGWITA